MQYVKRMSLGLVTQGVSALKSTLMTGAGTSGIYLPIQHCF